MKKMKNKLKEKKGVTLIALVITIIVLLILAGLSISMLIGDNGLITKAQQAKVKTQIASQEEQVNIKDYEDLINGEYVEVQQVNDSKPGELFGSGTEEDAYIIESIEDLVKFADDVRNAENLFENKYVKLKNSLDFYSDKSYANPNKKYKYNQETHKFEEDENSTQTLKELLVTGEGWKPIGEVYEFSSNCNSLFKGIFDGNNCVIKNLYIKTDTQEVGDWGLFSINKGTIQNLKIINTSIEMNGKDEVYIMVGAIAGQNEGNINSCVSSGNIKYNGSYGLASGITGINKGNIKNCYNKTNITGSMMYAAGIAAQNLSAIELCGNYGQIQICGIAKYIGGISGLCTSISNSIPTINKCYNNGNFTVSGDEGGNVGGIVGQALCIVKDCYNVGNINTRNCTTNKNIGGVVGFTNNIIYNTYNLGTIDAGENNNVGGILGYLNGRGGNLKNCYNEGEFTNKSVTNQGGVVGYYNPNTIMQNNFFINNIEKSIGAIDEIDSQYNTRLQEKMNMNQLLELLSTDSDSWQKDTQNVNNGYPIFKK